MSIDIKSLGGSPVTRGNNTHKGAVRSRNAGKTTAQPTGPASGDTLSLSGTAQKVLSELRISLTQPPSIDQARVGDLRNSIARNTYQVDALRLAEKFLRHEGALTALQQTAHDDP